MTAPAVAPTSDVDLFTDEALAEPYEIYRELRDLGSVVHLSAHDVYAIPRYAAVRAISRDWEGFTSTQGITLNEELNKVSSGLLICSDPPEHRVMRDVFQRPFRGERLHALRSQLEHEAQTVVEALVEQGTFDAVREFAQHLPVTIVSELVGLGDFGRDNMLDWAAAAFDAHGPMNDRTRGAMPKLAEFFEFATRQARPGALDPGGWAAELFAAGDRGDLPAEKCPFMILDYAGPSLDTTIHGTSSAVWLFAQYPDQWNSVREDPLLIRHAINEVLRLESPIPRFTRVATSDHEIDGVTVPAGSRVMLLYGSANRDERKYPDPDRFDVTRRPGDHLAFGYGEHACVGMNLARLEMQLMLDELARRAERIEIVGYERGLNSNLRGLARLDVRVTPADDPDRSDRRA